MFYNSPVVDSLNYRIRGICMAKTWVCSVCGYMYDPALGDPDGGIPPGTAFEDLPETWTCPECGAAKESFQSQDVMQDTIVR